nr:uncharacterized protein LOC124817068 [Hydra vulgaris]
MQLTKRYQNLEFLNVSNFADLETINGMVWRFLIVADINVKIACIRDLDSKNLERELDAVKVWLASSKLVYSIKDHPQHAIPILGGMWCFRNEQNQELGFKIAKLCIENCMHRDPIKQLEASYGDDQNILNQHIFPLIPQNLFIHDSYLCHNDVISKLFPSKRDLNGEFVGQIRGTSEYLKSVLLHVVQKNIKIGNIANNVIKYSRLIFYYIIIFLFCARFLTLTKKANIVHISTF